MMEKYPLGRSPQNEDRMHIFASQEAEHAITLFTENYDRFKMENLRDMDLYSGDFRPMPPRSTLLNGQLQLLLPTDIFFLTINYEELYGKFIKALRYDMLMYDIDTGHGVEIPKSRTKNLTSFLRTNPNGQLGYTYMVYRLNSGLDEERRVEVKRYFLDEAKILPIAETWTALKHRKL